MTERNPVMVAILVVVSCGLYGIYHAYVTTQELTAFAGRTDINPGTELLINLVTCGLFGMYVEYRNQQIIDGLYKQRGVAHEDKAQMVGICNIATFVVGATWIIATFIYQDELNKVAQLGAGAGAPAPATF